MNRSFSWGSWCLFSINVPGSTDEWWNKEIGLGQEDEWKDIIEVHVAYDTCTKTRILPMTTFACVYSLCKKSCSRWCCRMEVHTKQKHGEKTPACCHWIGFCSFQATNWRQTTGQRRSWKQDEYGSRGACRLERWFFTPVGCGGWCLSPDDPVLRSQHMLNKFVGLMRFDTYLPWHPTTWIILRWISVGRPLGPQDVTCVQRGDPEQRVTTCYSHPGKEMPKFYLASWREDSINLVCKVKNKSSKTWRSKSYSARNPISISMLTSSFQTWSFKKTAGNDPKRHHYWSTRHRWNNHHRVQREYLRNDRSCRETGAVGVFFDELVWEIS